MLLTGLPLRRQLAAELIRARQEKIARVLVKPSFDSEYVDMDCCRSRRRRKKEQATAAAIIAEI